MAPQTIPDITVTGPIRMLSSSLTNMEVGEWRRNRSSTATTGDLPLHLLTIPQMDGKEGEEEVGIENEELKRRNKEDKWYEENYCGWCANGKDILMRETLEFCDECGLEMVQLSEDEKEEERRRRERSAGTNYLKLYT